MWNSDFKNIFQYRDMKEAINTEIIRGISFF